jgi:hypothetical protein
MGVQTSDELIHQLARLQHGVLSLDQARAVGLSKDDVRTRVRRGQYRRLWRGVIWVDAELTDEPPWESRAAGALLFHGPRAVLGLSSATRALAISGADQSDRSIDILLPTGCERHQVPGIALHFWDVPPHRRVTAGALRCSDPVQTLGDLVPRLSRNCAVSVLDSALNKGLLQPSDLALAQDIAAGRPGCETARTWWRLADGRAQSPLETWVRLDCVDGGVAPDELQFPVHDRHGRVIGYGDMAWVKGRRRPLIGEADGADVHSRPGALFGDRHRANAFVAQGADIIRFTWRDAHQRGRCAAMARQVLRGT